MTTSDPRSRASRTVTVLVALVALVAGLAIGAIGLGLPSGASPRITAEAAPPVAASTVQPTPDPVLPTSQNSSLVAVETRTRTPEQARADRERSVQVSRMARVAQMRTRIVDVARKQIGDRYVPGRSGPDAFDCSGLTRYVYRMAMGVKLPHNSRAQYSKVKKISRSNAQPGDLVFFFENGEHHVGIYIGNGKMIDAPGVGDPVRVSPISGDWWGRSYTGMGRILPA